VYVPARGKSEKAIFPTGQVKSRVVTGLGTTVEATAGEAIVLTAQVPMVPTTERRSKAKSDDNVNFSLFSLLNGSDEAKDPTSKGMSDRSKSKEALMLVESINGMVATLG
jgi:hypothetical protein